MGLNDVTINRVPGGLDRPLTGEDHISGMIFYTAGSLPSGFGSSDRIKKIFSIDDAEKLGILDDHADETVATGGQVTVTGTWIAGEIVRIELDGGSLGQFTVVSGAVTIGDVVAGLVAAINANTNAGLKHGWVATDADPIITLVQPAKLGLANDTGAPLVFVDRNATDTAASAGGSSTDVQMSGGVASYFAIMHYHISEYFRIQPDGVLFVAIYAQATFDATQIALVQNFSKNTIRQTGIYLSHEAFAGGQLTTIQSELDTLAVEHKPIVVLLHANMFALTLATLANLSTLSNARTGALIGEEGDWHQSLYSNTTSYLPGVKVTFQGRSYISKASVSTGAVNSPFDLTQWTDLRINLVEISGFSIGTTGIGLGTLSLSGVEENIGHVAKFNLVTDTGLDEVAFATGDLFETTTTTLLGTLDDFHYIFLRKIEGITGTYFNDSNTAIIETNDFATLENNRTADKAERNIRTNMLPNLNSKLFVDTSTGQLSEATIAQFKNDTSRALVQMETDGEISGFSVVIDPSQNVLSASKVVIGVKIVPVGIAREIEINIGFALKVA